MEVTNITYVILDHDIEGLHMQVAVLDDGMITFTIVKNNEAVAKSVIEAKDFQHLCNCIQIERLR